MFLILAAFLAAAAVHLQSAGGFSGHDRCLTAAVSCRLASLDPCNIESAECAQLLSPMFDGLVRAGEVPGKVRPALAESWHRSPDGKHWIFCLRSGVSFHDGSELSAASVAEFFSRVSGGQLQKKAGSSEEYVLNANSQFSQGNWLERADSRLGEPIPHASEFYVANLGGCRPALTGIKVLDSRRIEFILSRPLADFPEILAAPCMYVSAPSSLSGCRFTPVGTGPFQFAEYRPGRLTLRAFQKCWRGAPKFGTLIFFNTENCEARIRELRSGRADFAFGIPKAEAEAVCGKTFSAASVKADVPGTSGPSMPDTADTGGKIVLLKQPALTQVTLVMNCSRRPFVDIRGRDALRCAISKERLIRELWDGSASPAYGILSPAGRGACEQQPEAVTFDPNKAERLFDRIYGISGSDSARTADLIFRRDASAADTEKTAARIAAQLKETGLNVRLCGVEGGGLRRVAAGGNCPLILKAETVPNTVPYVELNRSWSRFQGRGLLVNQSQYFSRRIFSLLEAAGCVRTLEEEKKLCLSVQEKLDDDRALCNLAWLETAHLYSSEISELKADRFGFVHLEEAVFR